MLRIERQQKRFTRLDEPKLAEASITERYDLQEFIFNSPEQFFEVRSLGHCEEPEFRPKQEGELGLQPLDPPSQVPDFEESAHVDGTALVNVIAVYVCQAARCHIDSGRCHDSVLNSNVV